jgi:hypothetical protein
MSRKSLFPILLGAAAGVALLGSTGRSTSGTGRRRGRRAAEREQSRQAADHAARRYLMYMIMPVWSAAGFLDWLWHRQTKIETTSGTKESIMHLVMMAEAGVPILTGLFLHMNAGAFALMSAGWLVHELTVAWDVRYTISRRVIYPREQHTHSYMQTIPFDVIAALACLYPEQFMALLGLGPEKADFKLRFRKPPVPLKDFAAIVAGMGLVSGLPHVEELWRCYRAQKSGAAGRDIPERARELYGS